MTSLRGNTLLWLTQVSGVEASTWWMCNRQATSRVMGRYKTGTERNGTGTIWTWTPVIIARLMRVLFRSIPGFMPSPSRVMGSLFFFLMCVFLLLNSGVCVWYACYCAWVYPPGILVRHYTGKVGLKKRMICDLSSKCGRFVNNVIYLPNLDDKYMFVFIELKSSKFGCFDDSEYVCESPKGGRFV